MRYQAQGFQQAALIRSCEKEKAISYKLVRRVTISDISADANVTRSHTIYKINTNDDATLSPKAVIALHGNEDSLKAELRSELACAHLLACALYFHLLLCFNGTSRKLTLSPLYFRLAPRSARSPLSHSVKAATAPATGYSRQPRKAL